jgi:hypothetical protein
MQKPGQTQRNKIFSNQCIEYDFKFDTSKKRMINVSTGLVQLPAGKCMENFWTLFALNGLYLLILF